MMTQLNSISLKYLFFTFLIACSIIAKPAAVTYTVDASGGGGTYSSIALAYAACTNAADDYTIEINMGGGTPYDNAEAKPITFAAGTFNSVTIRPQAGSSLTMSTGAAVSVFRFNGGDKITIDGRAGGAGGSALTIDNTQAATTVYAIDILNGSITNTIKYCTLKGSNTSTTSSTAGVVNIGSGTNTSNTIDNCTLRESSGGNPAVLISSHTGTNASIAITNNNIVNFTFSGILANATNNTWSITGNSFYQTASQTLTNAFMSMIRMDDGGHTITGNYFGGQAASCGGSAYTLGTTSVSMYVIYFTNSSGSANTISGNTIQNMAITSTYAGDQFIGIVTAGSANFVIGSSGNANVLGATAGTGSITITNNTAAGSVTREIFLADLKSSGTHSVAYNTIGAIAYAGSHSNASDKNYFILIDSIGAAPTIDNNIFGNTTASNMSFTPNQMLHVIGMGEPHRLTGYINTSGTLTITNNTFRNFSFTSTAKEFWIYKNDSTLVTANLCDHDFDGGTPDVVCTYSGYGGDQTALTFTGNTISTITSSSTSNSQGIVFHRSNASATISSNDINSITFSSSSSLVYLIYVDCYNSGTSSPDATATVSSNLIGDTDANDITLAGASTQSAIYVKGATIAVIQTNRIRNVSLSSTSVNNMFYGIYTGSSFDYSVRSAVSISITSDTVRSISSANEGAISYALQGVHFGSYGPVTISGNYIRNLTLSSTANSSGVSGICINNGHVSTTNIIKKNHIFELFNASTVEPNAGAKINGIWLAANVPFRFYNNAIVIDNAGSTNQIIIYGIQDTQAHMNHTLYYYHNTIKIAGAPSVGTAQITCALYASSSGTGTIYNFKNNLFQNVRTNGSHYAIANNGGGTAPTWNQSYDYLEAAAENSSKVGLWRGANSAYSAWNTSASASNMTNGTITLDQYGLVPAATSSDVYLNGTNLTATVPDDLESRTRSTSPWRGAFEWGTYLPVKVVSFSAQCDDNKMNVLRWTTATETNNDYFTVEQSTDGEKFSMLKKVKGAGTCSAVKNYELKTEDDVDGSVVYYRLYQTDFDGKKTLASQVTSQCLNEEFEIASIYPNPTGSNLNIAFNTDEEQIVTIHIYNHVGEVVRSLFFPAVDGSNNINIDLSEFASGIYSVRLANGEKNITQKIVKQ